MTPNGKQVRSGNRNDNPALHGAWLPKHCHKALHCTGTPTPHYKVCGLCPARPTANPARSKPATGFADDIFHHLLHSRLELFFRSDLAPGKDRNPQLPAQSVAIDRMERKGITTATLSVCTCIARCNMSLSKSSASPLPKKSPPSAIPCNWL